MRIVAIHERSDDFRYEALEITINDVYKFSVYHSEDTPEDNTLYRNFSDCFDIPNMLKLAYEAGRRNEKLEIKYYKEGDLLWLH